MRIHILGICGTFMGGLAQILKESGHEVSGADIQFYPPMSEHLENLEISMVKGYSLENLPKAELYVIGNALSRGNECVEYILDNKLPFKSGPEMLGEILKTKKVYAVSGTHGKTTTSYMLAHIFLDQGVDIGYLVGGVSNEINGSASLGSHKIFVIEADEYDSAFFDKRSKFIHYKTNTLIINNIEFDHADIFRDLDDIKKQFHHLIKTIPGSGNIIYYGDDKNSYDVVSQGVWSKTISINKGDYHLDFQNRLLTIDEKEYSLKDLPLIGEHNLKNYCSAILAANVNGISIEDSIESLLDFDGVKRRLENKGSYSGVSIYDDFAHHPTAIRMTADALSSQHSESKILGIIELGSNTMSGGFHGDELFNAPGSLAKTIWIDHKSILGEEIDERLVFNSIDSSLIFIKDNICDYDIILIMTNKDSSLIYNPIIKHLEKI